MGFEDLPTFPQGGVARAENGNQGIPPDTFQTALHDAGSTLLTSNKRPEDSPAVQAALGAAVDTLTQQLGLTAQPAAQPTPAYVPDTSQSQGFGAPAPGPSSANSGDLSERIRRVMEKYSSPEEIAKAYVHTDAARTQAQQQRAGEIAALRGQIERLEQLLIERNAAPAYAPQQHPGNGQPTGPGSPVSQSRDPEEFFKDPYGNIGRLMDETITRHLSAYSEAQARLLEAQQFDRMRGEREKEIAELKPFMDEIYVKDRDLYEALPQDRALNLLLERARDRKEAFRARTYHQEISQILGGQGIPANAAPGQTGALPSGGGVARRTTEPANGNWSNTPAMDRLWKSRSDGIDEMRAVTDILRERGFHENTPIY